LRNTRKVIGWAGSLALVAAMMAVGTVASSAGPLEPTIGPNTITEGKLRSMLVPPDQEPGGGFVGAPLTLRDAAAAGGLGSPPGMVTEPASCLSFVGDAYPQLGSDDGWIQFGVRGHVYFIQLVADVPGGADVDRVRAAVASCAHGTLTLEGRLTGDVTFTEVPAPALDSATTFITRMMVTFPQPRDADEAALLDRYNFHEGQCPADYVFIAMGSVLIWALDPDPDLALQAATIMHDRGLHVLHRVLS
jgi:hypothetical protein